MSETTPTSLKTSFEGALARLGRTINTPLRLNQQGACGVQIGKVPSEVVFEWIEQAQCVAVHAAWPAPLPDKLQGRLAENLMMLQVAGANTFGTSLWLMPDHTLRIGALLYGPELTDAHLSEAVGRVTRMVWRVATAGDASENMAKVTLRRY